MTVLRAFLFQHRVLATWLVALALAIKVLVPAGYMPVSADGVMSVQLCTGMGTQTIEVAIPGKADPSNSEHHSKADQPCAFAGLATPTLAAVDAILLALALVFILSIAWRASAPPVIANRRYLRPPLRGPPITA